MISVEREIGQFITKRNHWNNLARAGKFSILVQDIVYDIYNNPQALGTYLKMECVGFDDAEHPALGSAWLQETQHVAYLLGYLSSCGFSV
jgi:hypothetical protein